MNTSQVNIWTPSIRRFFFALPLLFASNSRALAASPASVAPAELTTEFNRLCDLAAPELLILGRDTPHYAEAYAVRALCVAHDRTGRAMYLDSARAWAERMVELQSRMLPAGAYNMNGGRRPGANTGNWHVADSASIAMGVLAVAVRAGEPASRARYLGSVRAFADLVLANWVGPNGGICNGHWPAFRDEWWCSTSIFASLLFLLHAETGAQRDLEVALGAIDWLNRLNLMTPGPVTIVERGGAIEIAPHQNVFPPGGPMTIADRGATIPFYVLEAYSAAWPRLEAGSPRQRLALAQFDRALAWTDKHRGGATASPAWDYTTLPALKIGGLPFHLLIAARTFPERASLVATADEELRYIARVLATHPNPSMKHIAPIHLRSMPQLAIFTLFSLAERVAPGACYRSTNSARAPERQPRIP